MDKLTWPCGPGRIAGLYLTCSDCKAVGRRWTVKSEAVAIRSTSLGADHMGRDEVDEARPLSWARSCERNSLEVVARGNAETLFLDWRDCRAETADFSLTTSQDTAVAFRLIMHRMLLEELAFGTEFSEDRAAQDKNKSLRTPTCLELCSRPMPKRAIST